MALTALSRAPLTGPLLTLMSYGFASAAFGFDAAMREPDQDGRKAEDHPADGESDRNTGVIDE